VIGYGREEWVKVLAIGIFSSPHPDRRRTQTGAVIHAVFYTNLDPFPRGEIVGKWIRQPSSAEIKNVWNYLSITSEVMWSVVMWSELMWFT
jgi:hypothetical protein